MSCQSVLSNTIFYQPLNRDADITHSQWDELLDKAFEDGYREMVIQWTQHGPSNFVTKTSFLDTVLSLSAAKNMQIWLGLYLPDDYYQTMENRDLDPQKYFRKILVENNKQLSSLEVLSLINKDNFAGWYLPMELTHQYLQPNSKHAYAATMNALRSYVSSIDDKIAISYFLSSDTSITAAITDIKQLTNMGFTVWVQRGNGLKKTTAAHQVISKMGCSIGVISENFIDVSDQNDVFKAQKNLNYQLTNHSSPCQKRLTFSLRYLPYSPLPLTE